MRTLHLMAAAACAASLVAGCTSMSGAARPMGFFITSSNPGQGGNLGGLAGADAHCQKLASSVGAGGKTWRAYLSTPPADGAPAVHARERIGRGPWANARGVVVASSVDELHGPNARLGKDTSLTEKGEVVTGAGDPVNRHDILTGSRPDGTTALPEPGKDSSCGHWTRGEGGSAIVGHHDRTGTNPDPVANRSWNASHGTRGCSLPQLAQSGSAGLFYCFAAD